MTEGEALECIRRLATQNRIFFTKHARIRMDERGADRLDVRHALEHAHTCAASGDRWKVTGPDTDNDDLSCVVVVEGDVVIITLF